MPDQKEETAVSLASKAVMNSDQEQHPRVVVCAETAASTAKVIPHAMALSSALGIELLLVHVIEPRQTAQTPFDPFEWDLRRREAEAFIEGLSKQYESRKRKIRTRVLQGRSSDQICTCLIENIDDIAALCRSDVEQIGHIGQTARRVLERAANSILMVPASSDADKNVAVNYQRILVPLDGSARAETALPLAKRIAQATNATLILVHAIPDPELTEIDPLDNEDIALRDSLLRRNERVAREYLDRVKENIRAVGLAAGSVILTGGDARRLLNDAIVTESADLLILSSHGHSGHAEVATGDVTSYLLAHSSVPVLMIRRVRQNYNHGNHHFFRSAESRGVRRPTGTN